MSKDERKEMIENIAERFTQMDDVDKSYIAGYNIWQENRRNVRSGSSRERQRLQQHEEGEMERLEKNAIEILHMMCERSECIICDSGGKDSSVLKHIALQAKENMGCNSEFVIITQQWMHRKRSILFGKKNESLNRWGFRMKFIIQKRACGS